MEAMRSAWTFTPVRYAYEVPSRNCHEYRQKSLRECHRVNSLSLHDCHAGRENPYGVAAIAVVLAASRGVPWHDPPDDGGTESRRLCFERSNAHQLAIALGLQFHRARSGLLDRVEHSRAVIDVTILVGHCGSTIEHTRSALPFADHRPRGSAPARREQ
jgi:hypothetical protein